jgi:hypothetical protein
MRPFSNKLRAFALGALLSVLGGCSPYGEYLDRRDTIALSAGNAVATDAVTHMVDPWPPESANRNIAFNGPKMQTAMERYRTGRVIPPRGVGTSSAYQDAQGGSSQNNGAPVGPPVTAPAAPVK